jgi:sialate O-acetylesterase
MQVHDPGKKTTLFSINHWGAGPDADIGIGNGNGQNPDWTFSSNAANYSAKRLRIYVRPVDGGAAK